MATVVLNLALTILAMILAACFGERSEKQGITIVIFMWVFETVGNFFFGYRYLSVDIVPFLSDVIALIGFSLIGIYSKRIWPLWAASLQLLSVGAHFVRAVGMPVRPIVYAWMKSGPTWGVILLVIVGSIVSYRRRRSRTSVPFSRN